MTKSKEQSIEEAKALVTLNFSKGGVSFMLGHKEGNVFEDKPPKELENRIVELNGKYNGIDKIAGTMTLLCGAETLTLMPSKDTEYSKSIIGAKISDGEMLYTIAIKVVGYSIFIPIIILREKEKNTFQMIRSLSGRAHAIKAFNRLENAKQKAIINRLSMRSFQRYEQGGDNTFNNKLEQKLYYALTKETFTTDAQRVVECMYRDKDATKHKVEQRLNYILGISPIAVERIPVRPDEFEKALKKRFYKMDRPIQQIKDFFSTIERAEKKGCRILLVGPPGVGKTSLMMAIAETMNVPFETIPMNGLSCPLEIEGLDPGYDSADAGAIVKAFAAHGTSQMVLCLDEFDKMNRGSKEGDPMNVFLRMFAGDHYDKFLQCTIKTENTVFIATANSADNIPEAILNRFNAVIYMDEYSCEEKLEIAKKHIVPEVFTNYGIDPNLVSFDDKGIIHIINRYCEDDGARDLKHNIERVISRIIGENRTDSKFTITADYIETVLSELIEETPALYFSRNRDSYSTQVAKEIKKCIFATKKTSSVDPDPFRTEQCKQKLNYLLSCRREKKTFLDGFDPKGLETGLHKKLCGMNNVIKEATNIFYTAYLQGDSLNSNLALYGGYGVGKSAIAKCIAEEMGYKYIKISLNGIEDAKELRGFSSTYVGSGPGRIIRGYKEAGSTRAVVQLDEIDKLKPEISQVLIDILDRDFTDDFLGVPVDLSQSILIATANDWGKVPAVIRDRFIVIEVDGYSRSEKAKIVSDYIIPRLEKTYAASGVSITIEDDAEELLLRNYATSFGVRDAEKAMQRLCSSKLVDQAKEDGSKIVNICKADICKYLGEIPIPRGNFPEGECMPGVTKALAVSNGNMGSCFAIETVLLEGDAPIEMTGLPKETATDSVKIAVTYIKKKYPEILKGKHIHVHFGEGSIPKDGPSAGVALLMSILSAAIDRPIMDKVPYDVAYTGELGLTGGVFAIGGVVEKIQAAEDSGCNKVFIPLQNYEHIDKSKFCEFGCEIIPVSNVSQVIDNVFPDLKLRSSC